MSRQVSSPEVVVAVVTRSSKDVGHPGGRRLGQVGSNQGEAVTLSRLAMEEELGLSNSKPGWQG